MLTTIEPAGIRLRVHREVAVIFIRFINEVAVRGYPVNDVADDWGYNCRHIGSDPTRPWSNHAWGLAVDLNATRNPMKDPLTTDMPGWIEALAKTYGLRWGGNFTGTPDPMHFEFLGTPEDARRITALLLEKEEPFMATLTDDQQQEVLRAARQINGAVGAGQTSFAGTIEATLRVAQASFNYARATDSKAGTILSTLAALPTAHLELTDADAARIAAAIEVPVDELVAAWRADLGTRPLIITTAA